MDFHAIWEEARAAAQKAAQEQDAALNVSEYYRGLDCGFAWVRVNPARGPFITWCKKYNNGSKAWDRGWEFWYSETHGVPTQSISVHIAACNAFAEVLRKHGIKATVGSRLD